ncbi:MAG: serine hydrolase [Ignavibacteriales bacterium]|nr:serine hydrolase [Ignavibacteriales bacterium]
MKIIFLILLMMAIAIGKDKKEITVLKQRIDSVLNGSKGTYAIAFKDLRSGMRLYVNERENFHAASTMKTPVMIEVFKQSHEGKFSLDDSIELKNEFKSIIDGSNYSLDISDDSEDGLYASLGKKETIRNLVFKMITVSSNLATNILIGKVGPDNVMKTMKEMDLKDIQVLRGVEDGKAFEAGKNNPTTAYDLSVIYEYIARNKSVSSSASEEMIDILRAQKFKNMIPAQLPADVKVAHKTGSITNVQHDSGIIFLPDGRKYILVILSKNLSSNKDGIKTIADISKIIYDFVVE